MAVIVCRFCMTEIQTRRVRTERGESIHYISFVFSPDRSLLLCVQSVIMSGAKSSSISSSGNARIARTISLYRFLRVILRISEQYVCEAETDSDTDKAGDQTRHHKAVIEYELSDPCGTGAIERDAREHRRVARYEEETADGREHTDH